MEKLIRYRIRAFGHVQGVAFRPSAKEEADRIKGITGFARNESDGSVIIEAQGENAPLQEFFLWVHHGPKNALVEKVESEEIPVLVGEKQFEWE